MQLGIIEDRHDKDALIAVAYRACRGKTGEWFGYGSTLRHLKSVLTLYLDRYPNNDVFAKDISKIGKSVCLSISRSLDKGNSYIM